MYEGTETKAERAHRFERIALLHLDAVYRTAVALSGRSNEAEDLTQTTFARALERFDRFEPGTNCKAWLLQILRNIWVDQLRRKKTAGSTVPLDEALVATEESSAETTWSDAEDLLENFSDDQIIEAMRQLPDDQRLTLYLIDVEQLSQQEVAEITDVAVGTVKSRTSRARTELKKRLTSYAREMGYRGRNE